MLTNLARYFIGRAERRIGVDFAYVHHIAEIDFGLLSRYNKIFSFLDPNKNVPPLAYHAARLRGAIAADCGTCVEAEIRLAQYAGIKTSNVQKLLVADYSELTAEIAAVARLTDWVIGLRQDEPEAREIVRNAFGEAGLIEISFAMNGAAILPGIKRSLGYATYCNIQTMQKIAKSLGDTAS